MLEYLKSTVKYKFVEDIYLIGFVDVENGEAEFYHDLRFIYFEFDSEFIEFEAINQFSRLKIKVVDLVENKIEIEEGMIRAKTSVSEIILNDTMAMGNKIDYIIFYNLEKAEELICDALEIKLIGGQIIFLDPSYWFGINIGGEEQKQKWKINLNENTAIKETYLKIADN